MGDVPKQPNGDAEEHGPGGGVESAGGNATGQPLPQQYADQAGGDQGGACPQKHHQGRLRLGAHQQSGDLGFVA